MCEEIIKNPYRRVWACVNLDALHDNLRQIAACRKNDAGIIAVIKADGYGHGAVMLAREMDEIPEVIGEVITSELGEKACIPPIVTAGGEDFFWYPKMKPELKTGFIALGEDAEPGLHDPAMHFNHDALPYGVKIHKGLVKKLLG